MKLITDWFKPFCFFFNQEKVTEIWKKIKWSAAILWIDNILSQVFYSSAGLHSLNCLFIHLFLLTNGILVEQLLERLDCSILAGAINVYYDELINLTGNNTSHWEPALCIPVPLVFDVMLAFFHVGLIPKLKHLWEMLSKKFCVE